MRSGQNSSGCLLLVLLLLVIAFMWRCDRVSDRPAPQQRPAAEPQIQEGIGADIGALLRSGDGNNYLALSQRDRVRLGIKIQEVTDQGEPYDYVEFLSTFYGRAEEEGNKSLLEKPIAEVSATAAAMLEEK